MKERITELIQQMTLEEKVDMVAGADHWHTHSIERLGIRPIRMTDGPHGARGTKGPQSPQAACFPIGTALASTWNVELIERVGVALAEETKSKGAHILLAPTVNIHRSPLAGRNFECYSEDPYLTTSIALAYINGLQSQGVGACIKHFVCNESEFERRSLSSEVGERALREIYLPPFKAAVQEAGVWMVMASYNKVNGTLAGENKYTLTDILKEEWGFEGFVVSDWRIAASTVPAANAGLDLEMPGPPLFMGEQLLRAVREGLVSEQTLDDKVRRILGVVFKSRAEELPETSVDNPAHRQLIRQTAAEGMVLLKNENDALPLQNVKTLAVIGPNAKTAQVMGGGSSQVVPHYAITPLQGLTQRCGDEVQVRYALGCTNHRHTPAMPVERLTPAGQAGQGLSGEYFASPDLSGEPVLTQVSNVDFVWRGRFPDAVNKQEFSARWTGKYAAPESGVYDFSLVGVGLRRLYVGGELLIDCWTAELTSQREATAQMYMSAGQEYDVRLEYSTQGASLGSGLRLGCSLPLPDDAIQRAATLAAGSDAALVFVGTSSEWESEGFDRVDMELPGKQAELVQAVAAANPRTIVVLNTGSPVAMSQWLDQVPAVLQAWFPGQECGNAISDVLFGDVNPSGKLPTTFPRRLEDNPAYLNYPGENGQVLYGEGIFVGYRYYDKKKIAPLFPFGHGLSYTSFEYGELKVHRPSVLMGEARADEVKVEVEVRNSGQRAGQEVVQLYVRDVESSLARPEKELKAFDKVRLEPGQSKTVRFTLGQEAFSFYNPRRKQWLVEAGEFELLVGSSSRDIRARAAFTLASSTKARPRGYKLSSDSPLWQMLDDEKAMAVLEKHLGPMVALAVEQDTSITEFSLNQLRLHAPDILTLERLAELNADLSKL